MSCFRDRSLYFQLFKYLETMSGEQARTSFVEKLSSYFRLSRGEIDILKELVPIRSYRKGSFLLKAGDVSQAFFYLSSGFVRQYYLLNGEEKTAYFYQEGSFISAYSSFMNQKPSTFFLQATENTEVAYISLEASTKLLKHSVKFEKLARIAMEEEMVSLQEIVASLLTLSPEKRYLQLLERNPTIFQRVPQIYISSFIGVKPESFSRIKKRAMKNLNQSQ